MPPPTRSFGTVTRDLTQSVGGSPTATEAEGMEFALAAATHNDPIAFLGYAPGVYRHGARPPSGALGEYDPVRHRAYVDPRIYGDPAFTGVGRHEFRHRGLAELRSGLGARAPASSFLPPAEAASYDAFYPQMMRDYDGHETFNRVLDVLTDNTSLMYPGSHDGLLDDPPVGPLQGSASPYSGHRGSVMADRANTQALRVIDDVTNQFVLGEGRRWGDW